MPEYECIFLIKKDGNCINQQPLPLIQGYEVSIRKGTLISRQTIEN